MRDLKHRGAAVAVLIASILFASLAAKADGGLLRIQQSSGPFSISAFTEPTPLRRGEGRLHVFVSDRETGKPLRNVDVQVVLESRQEAGERYALAPERRSAGLRASTEMNLPRAGPWRVRITAVGGRGKGIVAFEADVLPPQPWWITLGPVLAIPPLGIALFALHQRLRRRLESRRGAGPIAPVGGLMP